MQTKALDLDHASLAVEDERHDHDSLKRVALRAAGLPPT